MIKVIAFDYADVIAEGPMSKWIKENVKLDKEKLIEYKQHVHKWDLGEMELKKVYGILSELTGIPQELIWEKFYEKSLPNNELITLIKQLKKRYKIIIFSNYIGELLRKLLNHYGITDLFDEIIISSEHKLKKPDIKFFEVLVKKSGVNKKEILFTDDRTDNVDASNAFGIKAFIFTNTKHLIKDLQNEGVKI